MADRYPQLLRTPRSRWWRPLLGILLAAVTVVFASVAVIVAASVFEWLTGSGTGPFSEESLDPDSPIGLLANNLVLATMIPAAVIAVLAVHRESPRWLASVTGRIRWQVLGWLTLLAFGVVVLSFLLSFFVPSDETGTEVDVPAAGTLVGLLLVIAVTTPLQAAAEEVGFRGYLSQALASYLARPAVGACLAAAVTATLFALAHGTQDAWLFGDRLVFGLVASWLAWRTGGLEAPIAMHVSNNLVSLGVTAATGSLEDSLTASTLAWEFAVLDVAMMVAYAVLVDRLAGRWRLVVRRELPAPTATGSGLGAPGGVLSGPGAFGYPEPRPSPPPPAEAEGGPWGMG